MGQGSANTHVCRGPGARRDPAHVPRDPYDTNSSRYKIAREAQALRWAWHSGPLVIGVGSLAAKFYINCAVSSDSERFRGRRLTVGCPVVVSPLPREWSCLYRRGQAPNSFLTA